MKDWEVSITVNVRCFAFDSEVAVSHNTTVKICDLKVNTHILGYNETKGHIKDDDVVIDYLYRDTEMLQEFVVTNLSNQKQLLITKGHLVYCKTS